MHFCATSTKVSKIKAYSHLIKLVDFLRKRTKGDEQNV